MGDSGMGEPMARAEGLGLGQLPPFLRQKAQAWKRDTAAAAEDDWGPHPIDSMVGFAHAVEVRRRHAAPCLCRARGPARPR
jgi:hypothetical protein